MHPPLLSLSLPATVGLKRQVSVCSPPKSLYMRPQVFRDPDFIGRASTQRRPSPWFTVSPSELNCSAPAAYLLTSSSSLMHTHESGLHSNCGVYSACREEDRNTCSWTLILTYSLLVSPVDVHHFVRVLHRSIIHVTRLGAVTC